MPDVSRQYHISSAVVVALPAMKDAVLAALARMENVEVHAHEGGKIVVVIEGKSTGMLGEALSTISTLEGVVAANMVFEHVETEGVTDDDHRTDAA
ncbi:chaperone NapD [Ensifer sp. 4252]|uniref:chaperone NapD n=1 Tax=Ensifer sp. 4252 TaxID=3373915 RepID=UPI003D2096A2